MRIGSGLRRGSHRVPARQAACLRQLARMLWGRTPARLLQEAYLRVQYDRSGECRLRPSRDNPDRHRGTPPGARPCRWQVSWLAGRRLFAPSQDVASNPMRSCPVVSAKARRLQLRGQPRLWALASDWTSRPAPHSLFALSARGGPSTTPLDRDAGGMSIGGHLAAFA